MSKKIKKSKAQKRFERARSLASQIECNLEKKMEFNKFTQRFLDYMSEKSNASSESEIKEDFEKCYGICTLAWNLSIAGGTYEKSIEELNLLALDEKNLSARMDMKYMLVQALRMLFLLPLDDERLCNALMGVFTSEELEFFVNAYI